jgi:hypothetical protein
VLRFLLQWPIPVSTRLSPLGEQETSRIMAVCAAINCSVKGLVMLVKHAHLGGPQGWGYRRRVGARNIHFTKSKGAGGTRQQTGWSAGLTAADARVQGTVPLRKERRQHRGMPRSQEPGASLIPCKAAVLTGGQRYGDRAFKAACARGRPGSIVRYRGRWRPGPRCGTNAGSQRPLLP